MSPGLIRMLVQERETSAFGAVRALMVLGFTLSDNLGFADTALHECRVSEWRCGKCEIEAIVSSFCDFLRNWLLTVGYEQLVQSDALNGGSGVWTFVSRRSDLIMSRLS